MSKGLLDPKVDFVFKNIFGSEQNPEILISFLNATLKPKNKITSVKIKGTDIAKQFIEDKYSRLDVKATTIDKEHFSVTVNVSASPTFYAWVFKFAGRIKITFPNEIAHEYSKIKQS
ncbi:MAG: Rpn family recombination-promoting nuclease/putative transposase [Clostridiaceae bacterium]